MPNSLKHTPFYDFHVSAGARMVDFEGWEMPIVYRSIIDEHEQTRKSGSIFDVSHMGRVQFSGKDAQAFLSKVVTRGIADQKVGQCRYSLVCNEAGGVLDDVIVSRDAKHWIMVCNASNREKLIKHFNAVRRSSDLDFDMADQTEATAMVAIQGPKVIERLSGVFSDLAEMKRYHFKSGTYMMLMKYTIFRSGYTGEDGAEIVLPANVAPMAMKMLAGKMDKPDATLKPAGLGARDTLRLEAGMPLYGHELSESGDPISAGLAWAVDLNKEFIGAGALRAIASAGVKRKLVGLEIEGKRIARQGTAITAGLAGSGFGGGAIVGEVTSGTFGPTVQKSIAMAYVDVEHAGEGTGLSVDLKGTAVAARVAKLPFYKRK
jgi:aminomethyltransferase